MEERIETSETNSYLTVLRYHSEEGGPCEICSHDSCADTQMETLRTLLRELGNKLFQV